MTSVQLCRCFARTRENDEKKQSTSKQQQKSFLSSATNKLCNNKASRMTRWEARNRINVRIQTCVKFRMLLHFVESVAGQGNTLSDDETQLNKHWSHFCLLFYSDKKRFKENIQTLCMPDVYEILWVSFSDESCMPHSDVSASDTRLPLDRPQWGMIVSDVFFFICCCILIRSMNCITNQIDII